MKVFEGTCSRCCFLYSVNDRLPMFCPECGYKFYEIPCKTCSNVRHINKTEMNEAAKRFHIVNEK